MAFCTSCGASMDPTGQFCTMCGAKMAGPVATAGGAAAAPAPAKSGPNVVMIVLFIIAGVVILGIVGTVATGLFVAKKMKDTVVVEKDGGATIKLPGATVTTTQDSSKIAEQLDIEIYPGATVVEGGGGVVETPRGRTATGSFETSDPADQVAEFYRKLFPQAVYSHSDSQHSIVAEDGGDMVTIAIAEEEGKTHITLGRMTKD